MSKITSRNISLLEVIYVFCRKVEGTDKARCTLCPDHKPTVLTNKCTTNKWAHLQKNHHLEWLELQESNSEAKQNRLEMVGVTKKQFPQSEAQIRHEMLKFICRSMQPISLVEEEAWLDFMQFAFPGYKVPVRSTMTLELEKLYKVKRTEYANELKKIEHIAMTTDGWTCKYTQDYFVSVTLQYVEPANGRPKSRMVELIRLDQKTEHKSQNIADVICKCLDEWQIRGTIDKVSS